jgi:hypothetical protein
MLGRAAIAGAAGGLVGAATMAATAKVEQRFTHRPDSFVPGRTLAHLLNLRRPGQDRTSRNWLMHFGTGATVGVLRGVMAAAGLRGPRAAILFTPVRLSVDQTLENLTGVGAPPWTWPREELAVDVLHKAIYALATGAVADAVTPPARTSSVVRRRAQLGKRRSGRA